MKTFQYKISVDNRGCSDAWLDTVLSITALAASSPLARGPFWATFQGNIDIGAVVEFLADEGFNADEIVVQIIW